MRARYVPPLVLALAAFPSWLLSAPPVAFDATEVKGDVGAFVTVRGKTDGVAVKYVAIDPGLNVFPGDLLTDKKATVVSAARPGKYRLLAYSSIKDDPTEPAIVTVVIGNPVTPPPPVNPVDPVDPAVDAFTKSVADAYAKETDTKKADYVRWLSSVYRGAASVTVNDPNIKTVKDLTGDMIAVSRQKVPAAAIPLVRKAVAARIDASLGVDLTASFDRAGTAAELTAVADALTAALK